MYIGADLYRVVDELLRADRPVLFYDAAPSPLTVLRARLLSRVAFPQCSARDEAAAAACDRAPNRARKLVWSKLRRGAPEAFHLLERLALRRADLHGLLALAANCSECDVGKLACQWLRANGDVWIPWLPEPKPKIYIGGLIPMQNGSSVDMTGLDTGEREKKEKSGYKRDEKTSDSVFEYRR